MNVLVNELEEKLRDVMKLHCNSQKEITDLVLENRSLQNERDKFKEMFDLQTKIVVDLEMRLIKIKEKGIDNL